jgi:hypothetical protein
MDATQSNANVEKMVGNRPFNLAAGGGGIGFIIGEHAKRQITKSTNTANKQRTAETSPLRTALNLITSVHTLYMALPIAWKVKFFGKLVTSNRQVSQLQAQSVPTASDSADNRRRSKQ